MKIQLIYVGKTEQAWLKTSIGEYEKRLSHYIRFEPIEIAALKNSKNLSFDQQKQAEGKLILQKITPADHVVLLDENGKQLSSVDFAHNHIEQKMLSSVQNLVYIIGGPFGFSEEVYDRANEKLGLSKMTFSHQMIRLFFVEQLYRAFTIIRGEKYHHQ